MVYSTNFGNKDLTSKTITTTTRNENVFYGRVIDIIIDKEHPDYSTYGGIACLGGIKFKIFVDNESGGEDEFTGFAFQADTNIKQYPLIDEIVQIEKKVGENLDITHDNTTFYYTRTINIFNSQHNNAFPNYNVTGAEPRLGKDLTTIPTIRNTQPFPGDVLIEGRLGNSIRLSGYNSNSNPFSDNSNNGKPLTIIRNTSNFDSDVTSINVENVNLDDASIYLTSEHSIPLEPVSSKNISFKSGNFTPEKTSIYKGRQIIIDSGRITLHAKDDIIEANSKESVHISSKKVNLDSEDYTTLTGNKIYLGDEAYKEGQPAVKGTSNRALLETLIEALAQLSITLGTCTTPATTVAALSSFSPVLKGFVDILTTRLDTIESKKVFVE